MSAVKAAWQSGDPQSQSHIYWKVNVNPSLILVCLFLPFFFHLPLSFPFTLFSLSHTHTHTHTHIHKPEPLIMERTSWILSLSPVLFFLSWSPLLHLLLYSGHQTSSFFSLPLSLYDSLFIPHSQRAFFNTQCTNLTRAFLCACACWERERECEIGKRRAQRKNRGRMCWDQALLTWASPN